ncbi:MAG: helix-turn-helix domain-containing protein [Lachnospiraceae bacterium]|nr:helix-turn-helix domain-containing protein [Lachnospiraceae bacterium]
MEMILKTTNLCKSFSGQTVVNNNIRAKLSKLDIQPIATVWGIGYKWE